MKMEQSGSCHEMFTHYLQKGSNIVICNSAGHGKPMNSVLVLGRNKSTWMGPLSSTGRSYDSGVVANETTNK